MIINEMAGSGGDLMPYMFRRRKIGPLIGKRTWGGLVHTADTPPFIDGGSMIAPRGGFFTRDGKWAVENEGVGPGHRRRELAEGRDCRTRSTTRTRGSGSDAHVEGAPHRSLTQRTTITNVGPTTVVRGYPCWTLCLVVYDCRDTENKDRGIQVRGVFFTAVFVFGACLFSSNSVRAATLPTGFTETIISGIASPTAMAIAPDGRIFVCEQGGRLRVIKNGALLATPS